MQFPYQIVMQLVRMVLIIPWVVGDELSSAFAESRDADGLSWNGAGVEGPGKEI